MSHKPVLYLDVDDTILMFPENRSREWWLAHKGGAPAPGVKRFLEWARATCEVRWLTMWAMYGSMHWELQMKLAKLLDVPVTLIADCDNPLEHGGFKTQGINWDEHKAGREWFWVEDAISEREAQVLRAHGAFDRFIECNTSRDPLALARAITTIRLRLGQEATAGIIAEQLRVQR